MNLETISWDLFFYKYLSERMNLFANEILKEDGITYDTIDETTPILAHQRRVVSIFRYGLDSINKALLFDSQLITSFV